MNDRNLPHAWLFEGPKGVGKGSLARMLAGVMLGDQFDANDNGFGLTSHIAHERILEANHVDVRIVQTPDSEETKSKQQISVGDIRSLTSFFELQASQGGYRIGIVDAMDELNKNGANALLKTLEEPPKDSVLFLIYHGSTPLLPTIRSRCVSLKFNRLNDDDLKEVLTRQSSDLPDDMVLDLCEGSPGQLLSYLSSDIDPILSEIQVSLQKNWPDVSSHRMTKLAGLLSKSEKNTEIGIRAVKYWLSAQARTCSSPEEAKQYAFCWQTLVNNADRGAALRLDLNEQNAAQISSLLSLAQDIRRG